VSELSLAQGSSEDDAIAALDAVLATTVPVTEPVAAE
jgi:hypothetical protein